MKLRELRVSQWRRFREPLTLTFSDGINLLAGPNEAGKSTLAGAIRTAFFERYTTTTVEHLRPWGDSAASPEVELVFEWAGQTWRLTKRFLGKRRCDLRVGTQHHSNDDAENRLAALLGYHYPGRGASKPEHWGVPGLLWVEQGRLQELMEPVAHASDRIQAALGAELSAMTSSVGDAVLRRIEQLRAELLTGTGAARGELKAAAQARDTLREEAAKLQRQVAQYQADVDQLSRLRQEEAAAQAERPDLALQQALQAAQQQLAQVEALTTERDALQRNLDALAREQPLLEQRLGQLEQLERDVQRSQTELAREQSLREALGAQRQTLTQRLHDARQALEALRGRQARWQQRQQRLTLEQQHQQAQAELERLQAAHQRAVQTHETLLALQAQLQRLALPAGVLDAIVARQTRLREFDIRLQAAATRLRYTLAPGVTVTLADTRLEGEGECLITAGQTLDIPGVGRLHIEPGGSDIAALTREREAAATELAQLLQQHGLADVAHAQQRAAQCQQLETQLAHTRQTLQWLAPGGLDALAQDVARAQTAVAQLRQRLDTLPMPAHDESADADGTPIEAQVEQANQTVAQLEAAERLLAQQLVAADVRLEQLAQERQRLQAALTLARDSGEDQQVRQRLHTIAAERAALTQRLADLGAQIAALQPQALRQDIERLSRSLETLRTQAAQRRDAIVRLQTRLDTLGAQGLEEQWQQCRAQLEAAERRHQELDTRARALDLLHKTLIAKRDERKRRLQQPLLERIHHYLRLLFPGARATLDDALLPQGVERAGEYTALLDLSFGAQEQLGLISRLAYADLLQAAGHPTLIILDDALVHSDRQRLAQMKRILYDAAQRHQVILLSCHPENWMDVGAHVVQLDRIMAVTPNGNVANAAVDPIDAAYFDGRQHIQAS
ncbi:AAA family ATPase [Tepidimonas taiwanensis]|uniref:Chromosome partition protein Smc n=1 Tax=Tepidimonas taiwanensis TaxID=307486 RepID=A0A554X226_9BURK|nr:AAA family ATPase [Tepidimonas taiwanensis]MCX7693211.1 AAA family ATPase [Tepidimonas taiwanensis]TSE29901.1 Chromosome partition protein Smc [Tepidimonas taiwanensis]UBQ05583.1 AAA family ATPase [Tepidimonas taiwanensis]